MWLMITRHFIRMFVLFTFILVLGFAALAYADRENRQMNDLSFLESLASHFASE